MALFAANAVRGRGAAYGARPVSQGPVLQPAFLGGLASGPVGFLKDIAQGAGAGALTFLGAMRFYDGLAAGGAAAGEGPALLGGFSLQAIFERLMQGGAPGVMEILGAAVLFMTAGKGPGRLIGLLGFVAVAVAYAQGVEMGDVAPYLEALFEKLMGYAEQFQAESGAVEV